MHVARPSLWSPESPYLYTLVTRVKQGSRTLDGGATRIGIRSVEFRGADGFWLNGKRYRQFIGGNRHQDFAYVGNAVPNSQQWRDALRLKSLGFNIIRTAHYPQDPSFMDACDELGLFIIVATPGWQFWNSSDPQFEQRECEFFCKPGTDLEWFAYWKDYCENWLLSLGIQKEHLRLRDHEPAELAFYSRATTDIEYAFPFTDWGELWGIADRTNYDLTRHQEASGKSLEYFDSETNEHYIPYVIEPSLGCDRLVASLPERDGRYIGYPGCTDETMGSLAGFYPFHTFDRSNAKQVAAVAHFLQNGQAFGNMYETGKRICPWYAATMAMASLRAGNAAFPAVLAGMMLYLCSLRDEYPDYIEVLEV